MLAYLAIELSSLSAVLLAGSHISCNNNNNNRGVLKIITYRCILGYLAVLSKISRTRARTDAWSELGSMWVLKRNNIWVTQILVHKSAEKSTDWDTAVVAASRKWTVCSVSIRRTLAWVIVFEPGHAVFVRHWVIRKRALYISELYGYTSIHVVCVEKTINKQAKWVGPVPLSML